MTAPRDPDREPSSGEQQAADALRWGADAPPPAAEQRANGRNGRNDGTRGAPGLRWGGDGALRPHEPAPEDDPASPAHRSHREPAPGAGPGAEASEAVPATGPLGQPYASFLRRAGGWTIDALLKIILLEIAFAVTGVATVADPFAPSVLLIGQLVSRGYDWFFWSRGWTPGARILGMRIVLEDGRAPGLGPGFIRTMGAVLSEVAFLLGYVWMLWDGKRQTWHDKMASTFVILAPPAEDEEGE